jgi:hypothetical protein
LDFVICHFCLRAVPLWLIFSVLLFSVSTLAQGTKSSPTAPPSEKIDAAALLKDIVGHPPQAANQMMGLLKIRGADGKLREVPIKWISRPLTNKWVDVYQTPEKFSLPQETLAIFHGENEPNRYDLRKGGAGGEATANPWIPFAGSDFWLGDFGLEFLHWPNPKHIKTEMRKSRPCYVIETRNPDPKSPGYARVLSWIDTENGGLIRAESYTADGKLLKEFQIKNIDRVNGRWQLKAVEIRNDQTDSNTRLEFELEVKG